MVNTRTRNRRWSFFVLPLVLGVAVDAAPPVLDPGSAAEGIPAAEAATTQSYLPFFMKCVIWMLNGTSFDVLESAGYAPLLNVIFNINTTYRTTVDRIGFKILLNTWRRTITFLPGKRKLRKQDFLAFAYK